MRCWFRIEWLYKLRGRDGGNFQVWVIPTKLYGSLNMKMEGTIRLEFSEYIIKWEENSKSIKAFNHGL